MRLAAGQSRFSARDVQFASGCGDFTGKMCLCGDQWQILLLDSQVFGVPHGELSDYQLDWLETKLAAEPNRNTLLLLHHHPLPAGCSWLDQHSLRNSAALDGVLAKFPRVKICCAVIFTGNRISTGTVAVCSRRPLPACSLSRTAPTLRWIPSHRAGAGWSCMPMAR